MGHLEGHSDRAGLFDGEGRRCLWQCLWLWWGHDREAEDTAWPEALDALYTEDNVGLFVVHELVGLPTDESRILDGTSHLTEGLDTGDEADTSSPGEGHEGEDDVAWPEAQERRASIEETAEALPTTYARVFSEVIEAMRDDGTLGGLKEKAGPTRAPRPCPTRTGTRPTGRWSWRQAARRSR